MTTVSRLSRSIAFRILLVSSVGATLVPLASAAARTDRDEPFARSVQTSPFAEPAATDEVFVAVGPGLDTGCTFRDEGPLVFDIPITRFFGNLDALLVSGLLEPTATLRLPAFDVDFVGGDGEVAPERDRVSINGHELQPSSFLTGVNQDWIQNEFTIPIDWLHFPAAGDPRATPGRNTVRIDIDVANPTLEWCTAIDWATLTIRAPRPVFLVHGILSHGGTWNEAPFSWVSALTALGLPHATIDLGYLDSIGDNSAEIAVEVARLRKVWGVDAITIVGHSKGGIDSRDYIEDADTVGQLLQIGTPNAGSPLADLVQAGLVVGLGAIPTLAFDVLAAPAAVQLTTPYMAVYNLFHGLNPRTRYVSLAGDYEFGGLGILDGLLSRFYGGPHDLVVPVSSVHALSGTLKSTFSSRGSVQDAWHTNINKSAAVFAALSGHLLDPASGAGIVRRTGAPAATLDRRTAREALSTADQLTRTATAVGSITQGETHARPIVVDNVEGCVLTMYRPSGALDLTLVSPSGRRIDPLVAANDPAIEHSEFADLNGLDLTYYAIVDPEPGTWILEVKATALEVDPTAYFLTALLVGGAIDLLVEPDQGTYAIGDPIILTATLTEGKAPLTGATLVARIVHPDDAVAELVLTDDGSGDDAAAGDGRYTGRYADAAASGVYRAAVTASRAAGPAFTREVFVALPVGGGRASLTGVFGEATTDEDRDGLFNALIINVQTQIEVAGSYRLLGTLTGADGRPLATAVTAAPLAVGLRTLALAFDGRRLFDSKADGPYTLAIVRLAEDGAFSPFPMDERLAAYTTAAYSHRQFQRPPILLLGSATSRGIDGNGNGRFDTLVFDFDVDILRAGSYSWTARLVDAHGTQIGLASASGSLRAGVNTLRLTFPGTPIGQNGVDGPFDVRGILIFNNSRSLVADEILPTEAFRFSDFEGAPRPEHLLCAKARSSKDVARFDPITGLRLADELAASRFVVHDPIRVCEPVNAARRGLADPTTHFVQYPLKDGKACADDGRACRNKSDCNAGVKCVKTAHTKGRSVRIRNTLGEVSVDVGKPIAMLVPSAKAIGTLPTQLRTPLDSFKCYQAKEADEPPGATAERIFVQTTSSYEAALAVAKPSALCVPTEVEGIGIRDRVDRLLCYGVKVATRRCVPSARINRDAPCKSDQDCGGAKGAGLCIAQTKRAGESNVMVANQLSPHAFATKKDQQLCVPSVILP